MDGQQGKAATVIRHDADERRFSTVVEGSRGYIDYERVDQVMVLTHTIVPKEIGGRGIAGELVHAAFDYARSQGWHVRPKCSYAAAWAERHPEYSQLLG